MALNMQVTLSPERTAEVIHDGITGGSFTGTLIDHHTVRGGDGSYCIVVVYEKHYFRAGNRLTLTVIIDNMSGTTNVHCISGGGGEGFFRFDWGASDSFEGCVSDVLAEYTR